MSTPTSPTEEESPAPLAPTLPIKNRANANATGTPGGGRTPKKGYKGGGTTRRDQTHKAWADFTPTPWDTYGGASNMWFNAYAGHEFMGGTSKAGGASKTGGKSKNKDMEHLQMWPSTPTPKSWGPTPTPSGCGGMGGFGMAGMPPMAGMGMPPVNLVAMAQMAEAAAAAANAAAAAAAVEYHNAVNAQQHHHSHQSQPHHKQKQPKQHQPQPVAQSSGESSTEGSPAKEVQPPYPTQDSEAPAPSSNMPPTDTQSLPSKGSSMHGTGKCRPCAWFWKPQSCQSAQDCGYCHMCPEGELKSRKKVKVAAMRMGALAPAKHGNPSGEARTFKLASLV